MGGALSTDAQYSHRATVCPSQRRHVLWSTTFATRLCVKLGTAPCQVLRGPEHKAALLRAAQRLAAQVRSQQPGLCSAVLCQQRGVHAHCKGYALTCRPQTYYLGHLGLDVVVNNHTGNVGNVIHSRAPASLSRTKLTNGGACCSSLPLYASSWTAASGCAQRALTSTCVCHS